MDNPNSNVAGSIASLRLDLGNECLWWGDQATALTPKAFAVLRYLVEHKDRLVTKEALLAAVWPGTYVEEGQVRQFIAELRRLLHDEAKTPRFIETVHGRGYRFVGDIGLRPAELNLVRRSERDLPQAARPSVHRSTGAVGTIGADRETQLRSRRSAETEPRSIRPAIGVLPFANLGAEPRDARFAEAITRDVIDGLTRSRALFVVARQSMLRYRDRPGEATELADELGVDYVLEGTVRPRVPELRVTASLIDIRQARTIWSEKYDLADGDLFDLQDRVASSIAATIEPRVFEAENGRLRGRPMESLDAYSCVVRASSLLYTFDEHDLRSAGAYLERAVELDPNFARAHACRAWQHVLWIGEARSNDPVQDAAGARAAAQRALALDPADSFVVAVAAHVEALLHRQPEVAAEMLEQSLNLNSNSAFGWALGAATSCYLGDAGQALARVENAARLSPADPLSFFFWSAAGLAEFVAGRYDRANGWLRRAVRQNPRFVGNHRTLAASLSHAGERAEARRVGRDLLALDRGFRISKFASRYPLRRRSDLDRYLVGLRAAGLPE
jgi:TolB-like protein/DNA-binding winged helix-turn-helix (wHTH) protein/Tfp pilus assembly protein PilF